MYQDFSPNAQRAIRYLIIALLVGLVFGSFAFAISQLDTSAPQTREFSVSGEGKIAVVPDVALFNATVITQSGDIQTAQDENAEKSEAAISFLKDSGVEEKDIRTAGYNIYPQYQYFDSPPCTGDICPVQRPPRITGYEVRHTLEVRARDLESVDDLLDGVVAAGANEIGSISFTVDDQEAVLEEARAKAIQNAKEKAEALADELDVDLKGVISFSESVSGVPVYNQSARAEGLGGGGAGPVQGGEQEIVSHVNVTYSFR